MKQKINKPTESIMKLLSTATSLQFDGGCGEDRLHYDNERINVFAQYMTEKQYSAMEKIINKKSIKGKGYEVYAWNDSSGYKYWKRDEGGNYIQITVSITDVNKIDVDQLKKDAETLFCFFQRFDNLEQHYSTRGA